MLSAMAGVLVLHALQVIGLLDLGLPLGPHSLAQLLPLVRRVDGVLHAASIFARQVQRLLLQWYLRCQRLQVA